MKSTLTIFLIVFSVSISGQIKEPFLHYSFDNTLIDSMLTGNDLTAYNNATFSASDKAVGSHSGILDGVNDYFKTPTIPLSDTVLFSVWLKSDAEISGRKSIIDSGDSTVFADNFQVYAYGGTLRVRVGSTETAYTSTTFTWTQWNHFAILYLDEGPQIKVRMWCNGVKATMYDSLIYGVKENPTRLNLGCDVYINNDWDGNFDEIRIYNNLIPSESQIDSLYDKSYVGGYVAPTGYNPVSGRDVWFTYNGVRKIPSSNGIQVYPRKKVPFSLQESDTIQYYLSIDFENAWTTATVQSTDSLCRRLPMSWFNHVPADHSIVDVGGDNDHVWQTYIRTGEKQGFQNFIHLGDTATELYYQMEEWVDAGFDQTDLLGKGASGKLPGGFAMGNSISYDTNTNYVSGMAGHVHNVWGATNMMLYTYDHDHFGYANGVTGQWSLPRGYFQKKTIRLNVGTPGNHDAFFEMFIDGVLEAQMTGLKFRSITQGEDFGKIEALWNSFQWGGDGYYQSPRDNILRIDNLLVYKLYPSSENYVSGPSPAGRLLPHYTLPYSELVPDDLLHDELFTNLEDTIYDVGVSYIYNPPNKREAVYKTVSLPAGSTVSFTFLVEEFGWSGTGSTYVKVYSGDKNGTLLHTFGLTADGRTDPSGTYTVSNNVVTFEIYIGYSNYDKRGIAIRYWKP